MRDTSDIPVLWSSLADRGRHRRDDQYLNLLDEFGINLLSMSSLKSQQQSEYSSASSTNYTALQQQDIQSVPCLLDNYYSGPIMGQVSSEHCTVPTTTARASLASESLEPFCIRDDAVCPVDVNSEGLGFLHSTHICEHYKKPRFSSKVDSNAQVELPFDTVSKAETDLCKQVAIECPGLNAQARDQIIHVEGTLDSVLHKPVDEGQMFFSQGISDKLLDIQALDLFSNDHVELFSGNTHIPCSQSSSILLNGDDNLHVSEMIPSSDDTLQKLFKREFDEFDDYLASLKKEEDVQADELTCLTSYPALLDADDSDIWNGSSSGASFWDHECKKHASISKMSANGGLNISTSCQTVETNILHMDTLGGTPNANTIQTRNYAGLTNIKTPFSNLDFDVCHQQLGKQNVALSAGECETTRASKKRNRQSEKSRPRPKDRQLIQDRVQELRSIIPSSGKCSIDALLEKTIKYMNFLQTVTEEAYAWKDDASQQDEGYDGTYIEEHGTTWAMELGGKGKECPLFIQDLGKPRHMLLKMQCEEKEVFLEIVDTVRGLGLKILKGFMELRAGKMWAQLVIKGNEEVHRVHIICALMHLLESARESSSAITELAYP
ncbi:hypothetical protein KP509_19G004600 [Ceratopteris richardii]|uniref:BHLH domain-containing protein n=1 Tax=Ceratopteris richardii TaxID=49495 RepID=A0A8T2SJF9_CERRI|nr:hypothetical protein KP509_19G004600 [Ceratopteris richardii]KAH7351592.1 hypothetical protein KP509_19G004600 [Ceratopteris richardii]